MNIPRPSRLPRSAAVVATAATVFSLTPLPATAADSTTYTDPTFAFAIHYEAPYAVAETPAWVSSTGVPPSSTATFANATAAPVQDYAVTFFTVAVFPLNSQPTPAQVRRQLRHSVLPNLASSQVRVTQTISKMRVNGIAGYQTQARFTISGVQIRAKLVFLAVGARQYQFVAQAPARNWAAQERIFNRMIQSFTPPAA
ncbi:MAG: PsbP-related protein [Candidatus Nanopelagicales bacterium]